MSSEGIEGLVNELKAKEARIRRIRQRLEETLRKKNWLDWNKMLKSS